MNKFHIFREREGHKHLSDFAVNQQNVNVPEIKMQCLKFEYENKMAKLEKDHKTEIAKLIQNHETVIVRLKQNHETKITKLEEAIAKLEGGSTTRK